MNIFENWQSIVGISYTDSIVATVALGILLGVYSAAFDINLFACFKRKPRRDGRA